MEVSVFGFCISLHVCLLPSFSTPTFAVSLSTRLKDGRHFWNNPLWLRKGGDGEATLNKRDCQDPAAEAMCVGEVNSHKGGRRDITQCVSAVPLL